jgi:hypothetical protein
MSITVAMTTAVVTTVWLFRQTLRWNSIWVEGVEGVLKEQKG